MTKYCTSTADDAAYKELITGLDSNLFASTLKQCQSSDREVAAAYLIPTGMALGFRALPALVEEMNLMDTFENQKAKYVSAVCTLLCGVTADSLAASSTQDATSVAVDVPAHSAADAAGALGYFPSVAGIQPSLAASSTSSTESEQQLIGVLSGLAMFLAIDGNRVAFCHGDTAEKSNPKPVAVLASLLGKDVGLPIQVYYKTSFCLWLLSFSGQHDPNSTSALAVASAMADAGVPRKLTHVLRDISAEKVIRVSLSTLRNLMKMSVVLRKDMVAAGLVSALESLCLHHWDDEDIRDDLGVLAEALESEHASMSTFDVYRAEVLSGSLEWSPPHRDETFWQNNVEKLECNNLEVLRCIVRILNESSDSTVLSVACHDLAQFVKYHPRGRHIAQSLGVKARLMDLMATGDSDVRRYALNGVQVLMITHWNLMQRSV